MNTDARFWCGVQFVAWDTVFSLIPIFIKSMTENNIPGLDKTRHPICHEFI